MRKLQLYLLLSIVIFSTGCPKYKPTVDFDKNANTFVNKVNIFLRAEQERYANFVDRQPADTASAKRVRNEAIEKVLPYIDSAYMDFITDLQAGRDRSNFVADLVELGGSAAVGIVNGERPLQIIGVALTAIRGGRRSADLNFYKEQTTPVLINKMDGNRAKVRAVILTREKDDVDTYPFGAAISDIVDYYNAGTLVRAFTELQKDTAAQTKESEEKLEELKGVRNARTATVKQRDAAVAILPILQSLSGDLNGTDATKKAAATAKVKLIVAELEKDPEVLAFLKVAGIASTETDGLKLFNALMDFQENLPTDSPVQDKLNQTIVKIGK